MKKIFFLMGIAAIAFASCAKDTLKEVNNGRAIDFRVAAETRASETTTANLESFYVTALDANGANYFNEVAYTKVDNYYHSSPAYYWPGDGSDLNFYAYAPNSVVLGAEAAINGTQQLLTGFAPNSNITNQVDFIATTATGNKTNEANGVALTFKHQLSQIEVKAKNANAGYTYTVAGFKIGNVVGEADFDFANFTTNPWVLKNVYTSYEVSTEARVLDIYGKTLMTSDGDNAMLLPQQLVALDPADATSNGAYIAVKANIYTAGGAKVFPTTDDTYGWLYVPVDTKWEAGYKYVYTLDFTNGAGYSEGEPVLGDPIKFTMDVTPWDERATVEATANKIIGTWELKRVEMTSYYNDGDVTKRVLDTYDAIYERTPEKFMKITVYDEDTYVVYPGDAEKQEVHPFILENNELFVPELRDDEGNYVSEMFIREITDTFLTFSDTYVYSSYVFERVNYYVRVDNVDVDININNAPSI